MEKPLTGTDETGRVVLQVCLRGTLYFTQAHGRQRREAVAHCFQKYLQHAGNMLCWAHPGRRGFERVNASTRTPAQWLVAPDFNEAPGWEFTWHGGDSKDAASHFSISALGPSAGEGRRLGALGYLSFCLPLTWLAGQSPGFPDMVLDFCHELEAVQGYGGISFERSPDRFRAERYAPMEHELAMRFPGLEVDHPLSHALWLKQGIKGGNWLTVLGERWLAELGGIAALRAALPSPFEFRDYPQGVMIQAGLQPQWGEEGKAAELLHYRQLAQALRPIRVKIHPSIHSPGQGSRFDRQAIEAWLARFDDCL